MLQKPDLADSVLLSHVRDQHGLRATELAFLPLGADPHTAVYRLVAEDGNARFLKLRSGPFDEAGVEVPRLLCETGVASIIPPLATPDGRAWTRLEPFAVVLYPFVEGVDGYAQALTDEQWATLGEVLRGVHATELSKSLAATIRREEFAPRWRDAARRVLEQAEHTRFEQADAVELAALVRAARGRIEAFVDRTDRLADTLRADAPRPVLCHGDFHAGNVLLEPSGALHLIDWDTLVLGPPEYDLALVGAGWGGPDAETCFYLGYGEIEPDPRALAYYRRHRVVEDLAIIAAQLFDTDQGGLNRAHELELGTRVLRPGGILDEVASRDAA